ncbi:hypothetical protein O6H91_04G029800 [Diphasiastrum complanatum]|uniref:Uncharacterized protein n=2 Tax=Diphasiastrum complanatum TaxID=34168 RepID=A0ACC2DVG4_DIPCM|nr:hypothetical protein O6H91_04G029800 [Diphasiastrum complanatum]KAJ7558237.1 hypothetical protein O6H91_04G029800 [Diphasiastrum complanatum]
MGWGSCFGSWDQDEKPAKEGGSSHGRTSPVSPHKQPIKHPSEDNSHKKTSIEGRKGSLHEGPPNIAAQTFAFSELAAATKNFRPECLLGEGGFGRVYKGRIESTDQVVAVKQLDRSGLQGNREFLVEVLMLSLLHHPNLVNMIGYCADGEQRLLVYEYMPLGCLEDHLHDLPAGKEALDWNTRMKIAAGAARGLEYLHHKANPAVIYRDFKSSNILLDEIFHPKLSDFGLAKLGPVGDKTHVSTRVMGTYGYCAPEYAMTGQLTVKSDVYSFGVVLLELITGRRAIDETRITGEQNLVAWARPLFKDRWKFPNMADPLLRGRYPMRGLYQAVAVAAMCLQEKATVRPHIGDVVTALNYLASQSYDPAVHPIAIGRLGPQAPSRHRKEKDRSSRGERYGNTAVPPLSDERDVQKCESASESTNSPSKSGVTSPTCSLDDVRSNLSVNKETERVHDHETGGAKDLQDTENHDPRRGHKQSSRASKGTHRTVGPSQERERAIAEAKLWGKSHRDTKQGNI